MKKYIQISLLLVALMYLVWAVSFLVAPVETFFYFSTGELDEGIIAMFAACLLAFSVTFLITADNPSEELILVSAMSLGFVAVVAAYQMFIGGGLQINILTTVSLIFTAGVSGYLLMGANGRMVKLSGGRARPKKKKKAIKKKTKKTKKKKKKAVKKRRR